MTITDDVRAEIERLVPEESLIQVCAKLARQLPRDITLMRNNKRARWPFNRVAATFASEGFLLYTISPMTPHRTKDRGEVMAITAHVQDMLDAHPSIQQLHRICAMPAHNAFIEAVVCRFPGMSEHDKLFVNISIDTRKPYQAAVKPAAPVVLAPTSPTTDDTQSTALTRDMTLRAPRLPDFKPATKGA